MDLTRNYCKTLAVFALFLLQISKANESNDETSTSTDSSQDMELEGSVRNGAEPIICKACRETSKDPFLEHCTYPKNVSCLAGQSCIRAELKSGRPAYGCYKPKNGSTETEICPLDLNDWMLVNLNITLIKTEKDKVFKACTCDSNLCNYEACQCAGRGASFTESYMELVTVAHSALLTLYVQHIY